MYTAAAAMGLGDEDFAAVAEAVRFRQDADAV
jgi:hypothetical protein